MTTEASGPAPTRHEVREYFTHSKCSCGWRGLDSTRSERDEATRRHLVESMTDAPAPTPAPPPYWCGHEAHVPGDCPWETYTRYERPAPPAEPVDIREHELQQVTGRLDMSIAHALTWVADNAPLSEVERQMIDHHVRDMRKVLEALSSLAGPSTTNDKIKALERAL